MKKQDGKKIRGSAREPKRAKRKEKCSVEEYRRNFSLKKKMKGICQERKEENAL
jgi:hypothetical protein